MAIDSFTGEFRFLSNFFASPVTYGGVTFPTAEHAFQAAKTLDPALRRRIAGLPSPGEAKRFGRSVALRADWERARKPVMLVVVLTKFTESPLLGARLADTADAPDPRLTEGNTWHDNYWGNCTCTRCCPLPGLNYLGRTLMAVRDAVRCD
jgi:ribA/ribD-fused uncharacterized protein